MRFAQTKRRSTFETCRFCSAGVPPAALSLRGTKMKGRARYLLLSARPLPINRLSSPGRSGIAVRCDGRVTGMRVGVVGAAGRMGRQVCAAVGVFVAALAVIAILGGLQQGLGNVWPWVMILAADITVNAGLRLQRARRRRMLSLSRAERMWRNGVGPLPH